MRLSVANARHVESDSSMARLLSGPVQENEGKASNARPIAYVTKDAAQLLIKHGDEDDVVPLSQSVKLAEALNRNVPIVLGRQSTAARQSSALRWVNAHKDARIAFKAGSSAWLLWSTGVRNAAEGRWRSFVSF